MGRAGGGGGHDPFDIFREAFGGRGGGGGIFDEFFGGGQGSSGGAAHGSDLRYDLELTLEEAAKGVEKEIKYRRPVECKKCSGSGAEPGSSQVTCATCGGTGQVTSNRGFINFRQVCPDCSGTGKRIEKPCSECRGEGRVMDSSTVKVRIPAGVASGSKLRSAGKGEAGQLGGQAGDLYIVIHVAEHELFERHNDDLYCEIPIKFTLAALGGSINVPTLFGKGSLKIPTGTQSGTTFRLRQQGIQNLRGSGKGDLLIRVHVEVPTKLTEDQKAKLEAFADASGDPANPVSQSFVEKAKSFFAKRPALNRTPRVVPNRHSGLGKGLQRRCFAQSTGQKATRLCPCGSYHQRPSRCGQPRTRPKAYSSGHLYRPTTIKSTPIHGC